jgi:hypothetical protein
MSFPNLASSHLLPERKPSPDTNQKQQRSNASFPMAWARRPTRGGHAAGWDPSSITLTYRPSDDRYFGDSDMVMVPKRSSQGDRYWVVYRPTKRS